MYTNGLQDSHGLPADIHQVLAIQAPLGDIFLKRYQASCSNFVASAHTEIIFSLSSDEATKTIYRNLTAL